MAESADQTDLPDGVSLPDEIKRREDRLALMATAKAKIAARAAARYQREKAEYDEKMARRAAKEQASGKKPGGKLPQAPDPEPKATDQINLTDEESRIMPVAGGGFEQAYNAQAAVDVSTMLVIAAGVTQAPNDKEQIEPMLETLAAQSKALGTVECLLADTGFFSEKNVRACEAAKIDPLIAVARDEHHPGWRERHSEPEPLPADATTAQTLSHRLKTKAGRASRILRMDSLYFGIPNRFQKSVELTFNYSCSIIPIGHDQREIAVTIPRNAGHVPAKSPVTMARNTQCSIPLL